MTDTPETDDLARGNHVVPTEFAEKLERERDRLAEALRGMLDLWDKIGGSDTDYCVEKAEEALQSLNQQTDE